jgi:hypothetical protein
MSKEFYIGVRASYDTMNSVLDRSVARLNQGMANNIRSAALKKGIKKTENDRLKYMRLDTLLSDSAEEAA